MYKNLYKDIKQFYINKKGGASSSSVDADYPFVEHDNGSGMSILVEYPKSLVDVKYYSDDYDLKLNIYNADDFADIFSEIQNPLFLPLAVYLNIIPNDGSFNMIDYMGFTYINQKYNHLLKNIFVMDYVNLINAGDGNEDDKYNRVWDFIVNFDYVSNTLIIVEKGCKKQFNELLLEHSLDSDIYKIKENIGISLIVRNITPTKLFNNNQFENIDVNYANETSFDDVIFWYYVNAIDNLYENFKRQYKYNLEVNVIPLTCDKQSLSPSNGGKVLPVWFVGNPHKMNSGVNPNVSITLNIKTTKIKLVSPYLWQTKFESVMIDEYEMNLLIYLTMQIISKNCQFNNFSSCTCNSILNTINNNDIYYNIFTTDEYVNELFMIDKVRPIDRFYANIRRVQNKLNHSIPGHLNASTDSITDFLTKGVAFHGSQWHNDALKVMVSY